jgi:hypothetical protein
MVLSSPWSNRDRFLNSPRKLSLVNHDEMVVSLASVMESFETLKAPVSSASQENQLNNDWTLL